MGQVRVCIDKILPVSKQYAAAEMARAERKGNAPSGSLLGDTLEMLQFVTADYASYAKPEALVMLTDKKWQPGRTLKIHFLDGPAWARDKAFGYFNNWCNQANLHMVRTTDQLASDIRVTFKPGPSSSYLGTDNLLIPKGEPTMQLGWLLEVPDDDEEWRRVCVHEMGHAIDFGHEQSSPVQDISWNYDAVYAYYMGPPNNWSKEQVDRQVFYKYSKTITSFSDYDRKSIMHYAVPADFVLDPADVVGWNTYRSETDKKYAALWYPAWGG